MESSQFSSLRPYVNPAQSRLRLIFLAGLLLFFPGIGASETIRPITCEILMFHSLPIERSECVLLGAILFLNRGGRRRQQESGVAVTSCRV